MTELEGILEGIKPNMSVEDKHRWIANSSVKNNGGVDNEKKTRSELNNKRSYDLVRAFGSNRAGPSVKKSGGAGNGKKTESGLNNEDHAIPDLVGAFCIHGD
ncbi:hypothetical protein L195_g040952 [Trifolium pratense]|uniref:Uncharacterized protein n=1 Tax=Trifolium pratense TaxID=57577 RepID=A0A2K3M275_TRIPR|nr:hypothetical protein L195_g040952 [Trifolium pratense]